LQSELGEGLLTPQVAVDESIAWGLGWGLAGDGFWHWGEMLDFECVVVASRAEGRGLVCLANSAHGLSACVEILDEVLGGEFAYPIRAVLERGW
jgi:hypothetical protein